MITDKQQENSNLPGLWSSVWKLLQLRLVIAISSFKRAKLGRKIGYIILFIFILVIVAVLLLGTWGILRLIQSQELIGVLEEQAGFSQMTAFFRSVPVFITTIAFLLLLLTSFGVLLQALYLSNDMDFLLVKPIPLRAVFLAKLLQAILPNFGMILLFGLPVLVGLGIAWGYHFLYYPFTIVVLITLALSASGIASLLVMFVVRIFPARRVAEVLGFIGAIFSILCSQSGQFMQFGEVRGEQAMQLFGIISRFNQPFSPLAWAGRGLVALGEGDWLLAFIFLTLILTLGGGIFIISLLSAEQLYYSGWASLQGVALKKRTRITRQAESYGPSRSGMLSVEPKENDIKNFTLGRFLLRIPRFLSPAVSAIIAKDALVLRRDLRNLSQLVTPLILGIIYGVLILRDRGNPLEGSGQAPEVILQGLRSFSVYLSVLISLFISGSLLARLASLSFSSEGKNYWLIKTSPVKPSHLIIAKYLVAYLPTFALSGIYLVCISLFDHDPLRLLPYTLPAAALIIAGNCGISLAFGVLGARLDWQDPRQMQRFGTGCVGTLVTFAYLGIAFFLFFVPSILAKMLRYPEFIGYLIGMIIGGIFSLAAASVPLILVKEKVGKLGEY